MTVIQPNSISGITSITAQSGSIAIYQSDGSAGSISGVNLNSTSGVSTVSQLHVGTGGTIITTTTDGLVGINSTSPAFPLDCDQASSVFAFRSTSGSKEIKIGANDPEVISVGAPLYLTAPSSQDLILRAGGSEKLRIDSSGRVTKPYQPAFYTTGTNYTQSAGVYSIIIPNTVSYNEGSHYNATTGRFTAPIAGRYIFGFWGLSYPHNTEVNQMSGYLNGSGIGQLVQFGGAAHVHTLATGNLLLNLNANDVFDWRYYQSSGTGKAYSGQWNMWGYLLG